MGADTFERSRRSTSPRGSHDIVVEAPSSTAGIRYAIRATAPGGICSAVGYYVATTTGIPLMHMYANDITLHLGVSHRRPVLPELFEWVHLNDVAAETVTSLTADFDDAPREYAERTTKLVLARQPLHG